MSRFESIKLVLWGLIAGLLLVQLLHSLPAGAADREVVGRYQIATAVTFSEGAPVERTYVLDTATGQLRRFHVPPGAPMSVVRAGQVDAF